MKSKKNNIARQIRTLFDADICYLLVNDGKDFSVPVFSGDLENFEEKLAPFNKTAISKKDLDQDALSKIKAFGKFAESEKIKYGIVRKFLNQGAEDYRLVLLSKRKINFNSSAEEKLNAKLTELKNELLKDKIHLPEDRNSSVFSDVEAPLLITDSDGHVVFANQSLKSLLNLSPQTDPESFMKSRVCYDHDNSKIEFRSLPFMLAAKQGRNIPGFKLRCNTGEGDEKWFEISSFVAKEENGRVKNVLSLLKDITKEEEIQQSIKETISSIRSVLYSTNAEGAEYNFITEAVRTVFGFRPEEIYENKFAILRTIQKEHFGRFTEFIKKIRSGEEAVVEYRMRDRFGKEHWVRHSGIPIFRNGDIIRVVGVITDITEEKLIQLKLEKSEERFRLLVDTADDLIFILNGFGYFDMVNKNGAKVLGYTPEEMIGRHFLDFIDKQDEPKVAAAFTRILNSTGITVFEATFLDRFDKGVLFEIHSKPLISSGEVSGMFSIGRNITSRKEDEQKIRDLNSKLIEANRIIAIERERAKHKITVLEEINKLKSEFISNVSHELRTPLASIVGFAETIMNDQDLPKELLNEFSGIILAEGKRLAQLINDILDFSKIEAGEEELKKTSFGLIGLLGEVLSAFSKQLESKELALSKEFPEEEIIIKADRDRIAKAVSNLISNSVKFTNPGGRITVIAQDFGKEVEIVISDTGIGIPEKELPKLFQKFSKVQRTGHNISGAGFGLVTVKQIVDLHKGYIKVKSEVNNGTTFIIRLPK